MRDEFLATTVHDVQQPITALKGYVQLAIHQLDRPHLDLAKVGDLLRRVDAETNRMSLLLKHCRTHRVWGSGVSSRDSRTRTWAPSCATTWTASDLTPLIVYMSRSLTTQTSLATGMPTC